MSDDDGYSPNRFYKVVSHENNGNQTVQYAVWGNTAAAALFTLGDAPSNGYIDSDPNAVPDETSPRPVTVMYLFKHIKHEDQLRQHLEKILNFDFMTELESRPPIGAVDLANFDSADRLILAGLFAVIETHG